MNTLTIAQAVSASTYPGRGMLAGRTTDGTHALIAYFIMGRSVNSRNRIFVEDGCGLRTQAFDPALMKDPSLIIYSPVRVLGDHTIVTNGDQTDTIYDAMSAGGDFASALRTRTFEPDAPNFTPRVSLLSTVTGGTFDLTLSILKSGDPQGESCARLFYEYPGVRAGVGYFLHTYHCDGDPIPSFEGEPERVAIEGDIDSFTREIWQNLNVENRVALWAREICLETGKTQTVIINRHA